MTFFECLFRSKFENVQRGRDALHYYQDGIAVPFLWVNPYSALFVDMGLGKTVTLLTLVADLMDGLDFNKVLIAGPLRVVNQTWPAEIGLWQHTAHLSYTLIRDDEFKEAVRRGGQVERKPIVELGKQEAIARGFDPVLDPGHTRATINEILSLEHHANAIKKGRVREARKAIREADARNPASIHLINREQIELLVAAWGKDWPYDVVIFDESSSLKDHTTKRFKALKRVRPLIKRFHQLTATPAAEGYLGLFAQIYLLDEGERFGRTITDYRNQYFIRGYDGFSWTLRPGAQHEIAGKIADICLTLKKEEYLADLKAPVEVPRPVVLTPEEMKVYTKLAKDYVAELPDGTELEAETAGALVGKLMQLASGSVYDRDKTTHQFHNHKIEELEQIVEEANGAPLLVAYWFKSSLERLKKSFPKAVVMDREGVAVKPWNKGQIPMLLLHPQGSGHGLNLQHGGHHLVFFDIPWSLELFLQTIGRLDRQGQVNPVTVHLIHAKGTVEEEVLRVLREKGDVQNELFKLLKLLRTRLLDR